MVSFILKIGWNQWCLVVAYIPTNRYPVVCRVKQGLAHFPMQREILLMVDLNARIGQPREQRVGEIVTSIAAHILEDQAQHFLPRRQYRRKKVWTWRMLR